MILFRVSASHSNTWQLGPVSGHTGKRTYGVSLGQAWEPPPSILYRNKAKLEPDFWDFDQGAMFAVSERVAEVLRHEHGIEIVWATIEVRDSKGVALGQVERAILNVLTVADVMDPLLTVYKPYGERVLDFDRPDSLVVVPTAIPADGLFLQPSGSWREILCSENFKTMYEQAGWTGLTIRELEVRAG